MGFLGWAAACFIFAAIAWFVKLPEPFWRWPLIGGVILFVAFFVAYLWGKFGKGDPS